METPVGRALLRLTGVGLIVVALVALIAPREPNITYDRWVVVPALLVCLAFGWFGRVPTVLKGRWSPLVVAVTGGAISAGTGLALRYDYGWDARVAMDSARQVHALGRVGAQNYDYLSTYPNNIPLVAIDRVGVAIGAGLGISADAVLMTLTGLCVATTLYAVHGIVAPVAGRGSAVVAQLAVLALCGVSPWVSVPYTDLYSMPFVVGGVALACAAWRCRGWHAGAPLGILAVLAISIAYVIKTTPAVLMVALILTGVAAVLDQWSWASARAGLVAALGAIVLFFGFNAALSVVADFVAGIDRAQLRTEQSPPVTWWVANGMDETVNGRGVAQYGSYNRAMVRAIEGRTQDEMATYARRYIAARWQQRGLSGMAAFYAEKAAWNWGDGMFWAWGEGTDSLPGKVDTHTTIAEAVNSINGFNGRWYGVRADVTQGLWLAVLLVAGVGLLRAPVRRESILLALSVLGIAAFTLAFQGRSRYLFAFVPLVVAVAGVCHLRFPLAARRPAPGPALDRELALPLPNAPSDGRARRDAVVSRWTRSGPGRCRSERPGLRSG